MMRPLLALVGLVFTSVMAHALPLASSIDDFSGVQGQNNWQYGFFDQGPDNSLAYTTGAFRQFDTFDLIAGSWRASNAQVEEKNNFYLSLSRTSGHPTGLGVDAQDRIIWAVRRYEIQTTGLVDIAIDLGKDNTNPDSGGITGRLFVNGNEIFTQFIGATDAAGVQRSFVIPVSIGDLIDFAIDPLGLATQRDGVYAPRADGTHYSARIASHVNSVPIAPTGALVAIALVGLVASRRLQKPVPEPKSARPG